MDNQNQQLEEQQKRQTKILMQKISFADDSQSNQPKKYKYVAESIQPFVFFFKLLALKPCDKIHKNKLILNIPDTLVFNDKDSPSMWFYTNDKGQVCRLDNISYYTITSKFMENAFDKQLVAVLKKPSYGYGGVNGNDVKIVSSSQIKTVLSMVLASRAEVNVIQRFVKSNSIKPSIMRTCWRKNGSHEGWILTSNFQYTSKAKVNQVSKFIVNTKLTNTFSAVKCGSQKYLNETLKYVKNIVKFIQGYLQCNFTELVCDFIKDQGGNWWYISTRAFILQKQDKVEGKAIYSHDDDVVEQSEKKALQTYTKCKKCKYCYKVVAEHLMTHTLTLMMILQCDQYLIKMGKKYSWLQRCYTHHVGSVNLYVQHKVCDSCYQFYKEIQRLVGLQQKLAQMSGIKISTDKKNSVSITSVPYFKGYSPQFGSRLQKVKYDTQMPADWSLPQNQQIKIELNSNKSIYKRCRFMIFIHGIRDIPLEIKQNGKKYYISYEFLSEKVKFRLNFNQAKDSDPNLLSICIDKLKVIYFFVQKRQEIRQFIKNQEILTISLYQQDSVFGKIQLELDDFKSDKVIKRDFFKMFSGKNIYPYLSWGLFVSLGLHEGPAIETSSLKLIKKNGLLFPQTEYNGPDPLPQDWIRMIQQKQDKQANYMQNQTFSKKQSSQRQNSSSVYQTKMNLSSQISDYTKRKTFSNYQQHKRKPYY